MSKPGFRRAFAAGITVALLAVVGTAHADSIPPAFTISMGTSNVDTSDDTTRANADGTWSMIGSAQGGGGTGGTPTWDLQWSVTVKEDPFIIGSVTITNLTNTLRTFRLGLSLPVTPAFSASVYGGSISALLIDFNGHGGAVDGSVVLAPSADSGGSIYRGTIDGNVDSNAVLRLMGFNVSCGPGGPGCSFTGSDDGGLPGPTLPGPGVVSSIGTMLYFTLTPGDRVSFYTNFTVEPVPLPAALPLLLAGMGALGLGRRFGTRRKRAA